MRRLTPDVETPPAQRPETQSARHATLMDPIPCAGSSVSGGTKIRDAATNLATSSTGNVTEKCAGTESGSLAADRTAVSTVTTPSAATPCTSYQHRVMSEQSARAEGALPSSFSYLNDLASIVDTEGACCLPGSTLSLEVIAPMLWRAVARGFVDSSKATFVINGLRYGFKCGVDVS